MKEKITAAFDGLKNRFMGLNTARRTIAIAVACVVVIAAGAVILAVNSSPDSEALVSDSVPTQAPMETVDIADEPTAEETGTEAMQTDIPAETAAPVVATASSTAKSSSASSAGVTGESRIAANAASSGGTNVVAYQAQNEKALAEYESETVPEEERRIVATSAAVCDIMDRLGIDLVGVPETSVSTIPSRYDGVTRVGSPMEPDMEIIKTLNPTDVIGPDTLQADLQMKYDNIGVQSTFVNLRSVDGLYESVRILGNKYGKETEAAALINEYNEFMNSYRSAHSDVESPRVLVLMGLPGSYLVATQNSYAGSLVELAGGTNVFHDDSKDFITVNTEALLESDPDIIIRTAHGLPQEALEMFEKEFSTNDIWKHFRAVKEGKVYDVDYMLFGMSATFDYPEALADLESMLYGD